MTRLGKIFINEILEKTHNLNRAEMEALHMYSVILFEIYLYHSFLADCYPYNNDCHLILQ